MSTPALTAPEAGLFVWVGDFNTRAIPKEAGFRWDGNLKRWYTHDARTAARLRTFADELAHVALERAGQHAAESRAASQATDADVDVPLPAGRKLLPYQRAGIAYAMRRPATLIGDEMGLGKTIQALGVMNADPTIRRTLVVCPASLKLNWQREAARWLVRPTRSYVADGKNWPRGEAGLFDQGRDLLVIINYDVIGRHAGVYAEEWDLLVVDECHYLKNPKAQRTRAVLGAKDQQPIRARRRVFLTGTPIVNRPVELWPIVRALDPNGLGSSWRRFTDRYCAPKHSRFGTDYGGAANLDELQARLRESIMVRRLKRDVLTDLPPKRRQVIELPPNGSAGLIEAERKKWDARQALLTELRDAVERAKVSDDEAEYRRAMAALREGVRLAFDEMARARHDTAVAKIPHVVEHVREALEGGSEKIVVFAHHHDVIDGVAAGLADQGVVKLTGRDSIEAKQRAVDAFQTQPSTRVFVGSIQAAGVGITLTAASHVVFAELDWVPGNLSQAEDRCHRIGQRDSVLVQHIVLAESIDARLAVTVVQKQDVIDAALNDGGADLALLDEPAIPREAGAGAGEARASESVSREKIAREAKAITPDVSAAVLEALQVLSGRCDGARELDGAGFNKLDARIGHELAALAYLTPKQAALGRRIVWKYQRQLGAELVARLGGKP